MFIVLALCTTIVSSASMHSSQSINRTSLAIRSITEHPSPKSDMFSLPPECDMLQESGDFDSISTDNESDACLEAVGKRRGISGVEVRMNLKLAMDPAVDELENKTWPSEQVLNWDEQPEPSVPVQNKTSNYSYTGSVRRWSRDTLYHLIYRTQFRQITKCLIQENNFPQIIVRRANGTLCNKTMKIKVKDSLIDGTKLLCAYAINVECLQCLTNCFASDSKICLKLCQLKQQNSLINPPVNNLENCIRSGHCIATPNDAFNGSVLATIAVFLAIVLGILSIVMILRLLYRKTDYAFENNETKFQSMNYLH